MYVSDVIELVLSKNRIILCFVFPYLIIDLSIIEKQNKDFIAQIKTKSKAFIFLTVFLKVFLCKRNLMKPIIFSFYHKTFMVSISVQGMNNEFLY